MEVWLVKVIILVGLFLTTYVFALLPVKLMSIARATTDPAKRRLIDRCVSFLSCFAAGVFLATCLLDLYPEVEEKLTATMDKYVAKSNKYRDYPVGECVMVIGFFMVLIVEQVVLAYKENHDDSIPMVETQNSFEANGRQSRPRKRVAYGSIENQDDETEQLLTASLETPYRSRSASVASTRSLNAISDNPASRHNSMAESSNSIDNIDQSMHQDQNSHSPVRTFIMLAALSLHSVFEGLSVGLQQTEAGVLSIFGALILHKCIIAFSIGLNLVQSKLSFWSIIKSNAIFCISSPIGIAIGIIVIKYADESASNTASGILQGLACGTFLYVTFFEVLPHEFNKPTDRVMKLLFVIIGFIFVNGILFLEMSLAIQND